MISLDIKSDSKTSSPIGLALGNSKDEAKLSFSDLLKGVSLKEEVGLKTSKDDKGIQNGALVLSLLTEAKELRTLPNAKDSKVSLKQESLSSLLKGEGIVLEEDMKVLALNPDLRKNLSSAEIKSLISDAKQFLKDKITDSDGFKRAEIKELPKTLKGLAQMAKTFGIEISKITVEEVQVTHKKAPLLKENVNADQKLTSSVRVEVENVKIIKESKNNLQTELSLEDMVDTKVKIQKNRNFKILNDSERVQEVKIKEDIKQSITLDDKKFELVKEVKSTPLFKAQEKTSLTTEQLVQTKQFKVEDKVTSKTKADETLKLLLRGEKPSQELGNITKDFSVATARVIAPQAISEVGKSLENLLRGNVEESGQKLDGLTTHKTDSFEVKLNEAKQMIKYLSQDVKTAIEDYKSPFTRIKVQLNPQKLGEVDITIVQRGKNLHVSISSNTAAINTLAINANELRAQLTTNGINNATLNFNNSSQNSEQQNAQQQQSRQNERQADEEYNYFEQEEHNEEVINSLEIVVPNYA